MVKICRSCGEELLVEEFYTHKETLDGYLNHCKKCVKDRINQHRQNNLEKIRAYDRQRGKTEKRIKKNIDIVRRRRKEVPGYNIAHLRLDRAVKNGLIKKPDNCEICGVKVKVEAHHNDYFKPLDVVWMCPVCHRQFHLGKTDKAEQIREKTEAIFKTIAYRYLPNRLREALRNSVR